MVIPFGLILFQVALSSDPLRWLAVALDLPTQVGLDPQLCAQARASSLGRRLLLRALPLHGHEQQEVKDGENQKDGQEIIYNVEGNRLRVEFKRQGSGGWGNARTKGFISLIGPEEMEMARLKKELYEVTQERDILKKAVSIFSKGEGKYSGL